MVTHRLRYIGLVQETVPMCNDSAVLHIDIVQYVILTEITGW